MEQDEINKEKILEESEEKKEGQIIPDKEEAKKVGLKFVPTKTKIAAWWMIVFGIFEVILGFTSMFMSGSPAWLLGGIFSGLFCIIPGFLLLKKRKLGWWLAIISLLIILILLLLFIFYARSPLAFFLPGGAAIIFLFIFLPISSLVSFSLYFISVYPAQWPFLSWFLIFIPFIPLILLLLDRKNFWKIAS